MKPKIMREKLLFPTGAGVSLLLTARVLHSGVILRLRLPKVSPNHFLAVKHKSRLRLLCLYTLQQPSKSRYLSHISSQVTVAELSIRKRPLAISLLLCEIVKT